MACIMENKRREARMRKAIFGKKGLHKTKEQINKVIKILNVDGTVKTILTHENKI